MLDDEELFGLELLLAEEQACQPPPPPEPVAHDHETDVDLDDDPGDEEAEPATGVPRTMVAEEKNVTVEETYYVAPDGVGWMVPGPGTLDTFLCIADSSSTDFQVNVQTPDATLVHEDFSTLEPITSELSHVVAYTRNDGKRVLAVQDFPYQGRLTTAVRGNGVTFDRLRGVYTVEGEADY